MFGSRHLDWSTSPFTSQYHRSLYTYWKRQNIHPTMLAFDAPTRQECTAKRNITNTPGQALALLNDPIFVEAARALAQRALKLDESDDEKLNAVYEWSLQRTPTSKESEVLLSLLVDQRTYYGEHADEAAQLVAIGQASSPPSGAVAETAAWTVVTRTVLNLHEFVTRP